EAGASALLCQPRRQARIVQDSGEIVEPVHVGGTGVEAQEVVSKGPETGRFQVFQGRPQLLCRERRLAPALPRESAAAAIRLTIQDMEDTAVKGSLLHLCDMLAQERGVRFIPPEFDQLLLPDGLAETGHRRQKQTDQQETSDAHAHLLLPPLQQRNLPGATASLADPS